MVQLGMREDTIVPIAPPTHHDTMLIASHNCYTTYLNGGPIGEEEAEKVLRRHTTLHWDSDSLKVFSAMLLP